MPSDGKYIKTLHGKSSCPSSSDEREEIDADFFFKYPLPLCYLQIYIFLCILNCRTDGDRAGAGP